MTYFILSVLFFLPYLSVICSEIEIFTKYGLHQNGRRFVGTKKYFLTNK
jgi:hypothetical protein